MTNKSMAMDVTSFEQDIKIDRSDLDRAFQELPMKLWKWGRLEGDAQEALLVAKSDLEQKDAEVYKRCRGRKDATGKTMSEGAIEAEIETDPEHVRYRAAHITAEGNARRLKAALTALLAQRDMLVQLGAAHRAQMQIDAQGGGPSVQKPKR